MVGPGDPDARLLLDVMCGGLTSILRMVGYDAVYALDRDAEDDETLLRIARNEDRTVITRDVHLANRCDSSVLLTALDTDDQLDELADAGFELVLTEPTRCASCNGRLLAVEGAGGSRTDSSDRDGADRSDTEISEVLTVEETPESVPDPGETRLWRCRACGQYFWKGSHWDHVESRLQGR